MSASGAIILDRANRTYMPGEVLSGKIHIIFAEPQIIKDAKLLFIGESNVGWTEHAGPYYTQRYKGYEKYVVAPPKYLLKSDSDAGRFKHPVSQLNSEFAIKLPMRLPTSFMHLNGNVIYTVKAIFDRPWRLNRELETDFRIISHYDLNEKPLASVLIREPVEKNVYFCICSSGRLNATISVPSSGFVANQGIPVTVYCENESSVSVSKIKVYLKQNISFEATTPRYKTKSVVIVVAEKTCVEPFTTSFNDIVTVVLEVPKLPPSDLQYCSLIQLGYELRVVICFSGMHCSIDRSFPILIGTVPLRNSSNKRPLDTDMTPRFSTPVAPILQEPSSANITTETRLQPAGPTFATASRYSADANVLPPYEVTLNPEDFDYDQGDRTRFAPRFPCKDYGTVN